MQQAALSRQTESPASALGSTIPSKALPPIDYAAHPAYAAYRSPSFGLRISALARFARGASLVLFRWIADYEHLPKPPRGARRARWFALRAPLYAGLVARAWRRRWFRLPAKVDSEKARSALSALVQDGVLAFRVDEPERDRIAALTAPYFSELERRLSATADEKLRFDDNRLWLDRGTDATTYAAVEAVLDEQGVLEAAMAYLGRRVRLAHVIVQLNTRRTDFWTGQFADCGVPDPDCNYCHVDTAFGILKGLVYLAPVGAANGPFRFVVGSHRGRRGWIDGFVRRANDYAGLSSTAPERRRAFMALPARLRRKCAFGPDLADVHPVAPALIAAERVFTSDQGDAVIFDPEGIHRGGMVQAGTRRVLSIHIADLN